MAESLRNALPMITGVLFALGLLLFAISLRLFRRSRRDVHWRNRRMAGQRGWRLFLVAFGVFGCGGMFCLFTLLSLVLFDDPDPTAPASPVTGMITNTPTLAESPTPITPENQTQPPNDATERVIIITASPIFTPTDTPFPTFTPQFTPADSLITPSPDAEIRITALDDQITEDLLPINPRASFPAGTTRVYLFVEFKGMARGVLWRRELYRGDEQIDGSDYLWGQESEGRGYFFFGNDDGFAPGQYEIRLYLGYNDVPVHIMPFTIFESP
ncbi:MAG: hypothetical protein JXA10_14355 [Anaerolineae bacterium]|nr:hypothetical protein [Anaerolineae bacterium]